MTETPSPFVFWAQTEKMVTLKVDLKDTEDVWVDLKDDSLAFSAIGRGARGLHKYQFKLNLHGKILSEDSDYVILDSHVFFTLRKTEIGYWPKLISIPSKPAWLKIDFDRWTSEDATLDDDESVRDIREDYPDVYNSLQKEERGYRSEDWKKVYLIFYNLAQWVGFLYIVIVMILRYSKDGVDSISTAFDDVGNVVKLCHLFQILEIMHPIFGYTKNSVLPSFLQVVARSLVLFGMIDAEPRMQTKPVVFYLFLVWSAIETLRYPYYISQLINFNIKLLTWLRYTVWIVLYPLGFLCEGIICLRSIPYLEETKRFSLPLPNSWNFAFDMATTVRVYLLFIITPGIYFLMTQMYRERAKKLGPGRKRKLL